MKRIISIILTLTIVFSAFALNISYVNAEEENTTQTFLDRVKEDYDLVWSDEFNGDTLDTTKWRFDGQNCRRNSELQIYADSMEDGNLQFDGESAIIVPKVETRVAADGFKRNYTSVEISTQSKHSWKYGYFEIRAKQACGKNIVPAIWMMGYDYPTGSCDWPYSGEIDIMERLNNDTTTESTLHHGGAYGQKHHKATGIGTQSYDHKINEEFHNYWLYWTDKYLIAGVDDAMHDIIDITKPELAQAFRTFEHWLLINVAMGMFGNKVDDSQEDQWKMWIDYVRIYQLNDDKLYDNYQAFSALDFKHNGIIQGYGSNKNVSNLNGESSLDFTIQDELTPGKYDIYTEIGNKNMLTYINGVQTNEIKAIDHGKAVGNQAYVGSVDLQDKSNFDITFKAKDGSAVNVQKLIFVKTDENKSTPVVVKDSGFTVFDYIEVNTEDELKAAFTHLKEKGTIKLLNDITLTERIYTLNEPTIDLNGKTLTVNGGYFAISDENKPNIIKNGNVIISGKSSNFVHTRGNNFNAKVKCEDLNITINSTASNGYVFNHNYGAINIEANNCEFTFGEKVSSSSSYIISRTGGIYTNCTFNLNGKKAFLMSNGSNTSTKKLYFNNCVVNDALYLFHSDNALTQYVDVKVANTTLNNLGALTNHTENTQFVSVADNGVLKQNGETVGVSADMTGNFTMECNHSYVDADCVTPKHCEYCNLSEGKALGHNIVTDTTQADCVYAGSIKTYCDKCSTVFSEKAIPVTEHNYEFVSTTEPSCTKVGYHLWACSECGMKQQRSYNGDGAAVLYPHTFDESKTVVIEPTSSLGGYSLKYCTTCQTQRKTLYKLSIPDNRREYTVNELQNSSRLIGRAYKESGEIVMAMSGSGAEFNIVATGDVKVKLNNVVHTNSTHYLGVMIDDDYENYKLIEVKSGANEVTVATNLDGEHKITLWHPNEFSYSTYRLQSLIFNGSKGEAPAKKQYTIDFYGDSITVGQGNVPLGEDGSYKPYTSNAFDTYAGVASRKLGADFNICAASGYGLAYGFGENTNPPGGIISKIYDYASPKDKVLWDYSAYTPDLAVVSLGQNDQTHSSNVGDVDYKQALRERVKEIIDKIRTNDSKIPVVFIGGIMGSFGNDFINIRRSVSEVASQYGYEDVYFEYLIGDSAGGNYHPSAAAHKSCGETLAQFIEGLDLLNKDTRVAETLLDDFEATSTKPSHYTTAAEVVESPFDDNHGNVLKIDATKEASGVTFKTKDMPKDAVGVKFDLRITKSATMGFLVKDSSGATLMGGYSNFGSIGAGSWNNIVAKFDLTKFSSSDVATFTVTTNWTKADTIYIDNISYLTVKSAHVPKEGFDKVVPPTCIKNGYTEHLCVECGETYKTNIIPANGTHTPDTTKNKVVKPTLIDQGYTIYTCKLCEQEYNGDYTPTLLDSYSLGLNTLEGASIRLNDKTGLRFYTEIDEDAVNELRNKGCTVELGTLISPYDYIYNKELTFDLNAGEYVDVKYNSTTYYSDANGFNGIVGSIVNIKESTTSNPKNGNILRYFVARGYAKITDEKGNTEIVYADYSKSNPRSLGLVAFRFKADVNESNVEVYNKFAEKLDKWALAYKLAQDAFESDKW